MGQWVIHAKVVSQSETDNKSYENLNMAQFERIQQELISSGANFNIEVDMEYHA